MKKVLLIIGLISSVVMMGEILMLYTGFALIANWGSIIIPSFLAGIFAGLLLHDTVDKWLSELLAACVTAIKLVLFLIQVENPTSLAILGIIVLYFSVSYFFVICGRKLIFRDKAEPVRGNICEDSDDDDASTDDLHTLLRIYQIEQADKQTNEGEDNNAIGKEHN